MITYGKGDLVAGVTPRKVQIYITCDQSASTLTFDNFIPPSSSDPPPPYYIYQIYFRSSTLCTNTYQQCNATGFDFSSIAANNNYQASWTTQTLYYAPCSAGIPEGCGTYGPIINQCYNKTNCCAVCQTWEEDTGPAGTCLGLSENFLGVTIITPATVKISYGGGDNVDTTPRQVDIYISCDPMANILTFVKFVPPQPINPPPPYYLYQIFFSSSTLCNSDSNHISAFLSSLGIKYP